MKEFKRRECLEKLLVSIFGVTTVNFDNENYIRGRTGKVIFNMNGLFDKNKYTLKFKNNFDALFDITFNIKSEYGFEERNARGVSSFSRDLALDNVMTYFKDLGIVVTEYFYNKYDKYVFSKLVYKIISSEILNAIFNTDDNREKKDKIDLDNEDITYDFMIAIKNIQNVLESENLVEIMYDNAKIGDIEIIYNKNDFPEECNYAVCFSTEKDKIASGPICDQYVYIEFVKCMTGRTMKELIQLINDEKISIPKINNKAIFEYKTSDYKNKLHKFKILNTSLNKNILPKYFCYAEKIDSVKYSEDKLGEIIFLECELRMHAQEAIREKYNINPFYTEEDLIKIIINVLDQILAIDYAYIMNHRNSYEDFYATIKSLSPNLARLCDFLCDYKLTIDQMIIAIYISMMCAIEIFCEYIEENWIRNCSDNARRIKKLQETISVINSNKYAKEIYERKKRIEKNVLFADEFFLFDSSKPQLFFENLQLKMYWGKSTKALKQYVQLEKFGKNPYATLNSHLSYLYVLLNRK